MSNPGNTSVVCLRWITMLFLFLGFLPLASAQRPPRITGTYSNMYYNREGGDVLGDEIKIVFTSAGYQGVLQFAEGAPGQLIVVDIKADGNKISFTIPSSSTYAGEFHGSVVNRRLEGEFQFESGGSEKVRLLRGKSYWD
jgi:hypothetical protein